MSQWRRKAYGREKNDSGVDVGRKESLSAKGREATKRFMLSFVPNENDTRDEIRVFGTKGDGKIVT